MWPTFKSNDIRIALHYIGDLLIVISFAMVAPIVIALLAGEYDPAADYFLSMGAGIMVGTLLRLIKVRPGTLTRKQAVLITGFAWLFLSLVGAIPLYLSGHFSSYLNAAFEAVSGLTTTGVSLVEDVDHLPYAHNMWRLMTHIIGGQGIIAIALSLGIFARSSGSSTIYKSEGKDSDILPNVVSMVRFSSLITLGFTLLGTAIIAVFCILQGITPNRSIFHGFALSAAAFGTGGFAPMSTGVLYYHSFAVELVLMLLMFAGTMNFAIYVVISRGKVNELWKNAELKALLIWAMIIVVLVSVTLARDPYFSNSWTVIRRGVFTAVAAVSNAGFSMFLPTQMSGLMNRAALFLIILAMAVGGSTGSTSGGIKMMRVVIIFKSVIADLKRAISPGSAIVTSSYHHIRDRFIEPGLSTGAMTVFLLYVFTFLMGGIVGVALGYPPLEAVFESVSVTSNAGLSSGIVSTAMPTTLKLIYILQMWIGRIEFIAILALIAGVVATVTPESVRRKFAVRMQRS